MTGAGGPVEFRDSPSLQCVQHLDVALEAATAKGLPY